MLPVEAPAALTRAPGDSIQGKLVHRDFRMGVFADPGNGFEASQVSAVGPSWEFLFRMALRPAPWL